MNPAVMVTGASSGLGLALCDYYLEKGFDVLGLARRTPKISHPRFHFQSCDLSQHAEIESALKNLLDQTSSLKYVFLNAGIIGNLEAIAQTSLKDIEHIMDVNVWANKQILDFFIQRHIPIQQLIATSSGASINGNAGWGGYSLSKATLNMLIKLYAGELPDTHCCALAPGLIDTPMLNHIIDNGDEAQFPSLRLLKEGKKFSPGEAASLIDGCLEQITAYESGSYLDIRDLISTH